MHKIRKTVVSALIDQGMNLKEVIQFSGHASIVTLLKSYCFNRQSDEVTRKNIAQALQRV